MASFPTSVSSAFPSKIRFFISAIVAIVVPSLRVFACITELPTLTGILNILPVMVARTRVLLCLLYLLLTPLFVICKACSAVEYCTRAWSSSARLFSYSSVAIRPLSYSSLSLECMRLILSKAMRACST